MLDNKSAKSMTATGSLAFLRRKLFLFTSFTL
jgi:hypothetical protein